MARGAASGSATRKRSSIKPVTPADKTLARRHIRDSIKYNESHAAEHKQLAKKDRQLLRKGAYA